MSSSDSSSTTSLLTKDLNDFTGVKVPRFNGKNYAIWKMKFMALATAFGCLDVLLRPLNGEQTNNTIRQGRRSVGPKELLAAATNLDEKQIKAAKVFYLLLNALETTISDIALNVEPGDAHALWTALESRYARKTTANKMHIKRLLSNNKWKDKESFDLYCNRIISYVLQLREMGEQVSNSDQVFAVLNGLPAAYITVRTTLESNVDLDFDQACVHIRDHEEILNMQLQEETEVATLAKQFKDKIGYSKSGVSSNNNYGNDNSKIRGTCRTCDKPGHLEYYCEQNKIKRKCEYCRKVGHTMEYCWIINGVNGKTASSNDTVAVAVDGSRESAWSAYVCANNCEADCCD